MPGDLRSALVGALAGGLLIDAVDVDLPSPRTGCALGMIWDVVRIRSAGRCVILGSLRML